MPKTFDLPDTLLQRAEAAAADEGLLLHEWLWLAIEAKAAAHEAAVSADAACEAAQQAFAASLQRLPDGTYFNPDGIEDEGFFETLESLRAGRLA